ncbi:Glyoxalase/bleomycin resistance protein/dioxygenase (modular protein) [Sterolibacterium denitrificans]|uniref:Glyoxalase/bleomycin resistance protein/dioxygenase (Modular protein) n=1 Tax=Sterolibacterium denitrificans TaxID=157592 RepID=A0A7Z7HPV7_9PROT|nr:Glyoxalase/bleomycin resistance protein/dioxygenase (modular protein) [Sterolibacterium denitrificans]
MVQESSASSHFGPVRQLGYVVADLDAELECWRRQRGVGTWTVIRNVRLNSHYRGEPSKPLIDLALAYHGEVQIELIQQRNAAPSPYRACIEAGRYGLHHLAFLCANIAAAVRRAEARGWQVACDIRMTGSGRYVYLQSPRLGADVYIELLEASPVMRRMIARGMAETAQWQGAGAPLEFDLSSLFSTLRQAAWLCGASLRRPASDAATARQLPPLPRVDYPVTDLAAAIESWQAQFGIGPWQRPTAGLAEARCGEVSLALCATDSTSPTSRGHSHA